MLLTIVFRTKPSLEKMSHYYYRGNRHPIKMSYLLVVLQVNKHIPEIHQEKKGVTEAVLYFDILIFLLLKLCSTVNMHSTEMFNLGIFCVS